MKIPYCEKNNKLPLGRGTRRRLGCEALEARRLLTAYLVQTLDDVVSNDGLLSLREAIQAANTNSAVADAPAGQPGPATIDKISFAPALSGKVLSLSGGPLELSDAVDIVHSGIAPVVVDGGGTQQLFTVSSQTGPVELGNLVLRNGNALLGGAIHIAANANLQLTNLIAQANRAEDGGAIYNAGGTLEITQSVFSGNAAIATAGSGGAIFSESGIVSIANSQFTFNSATRAGGGIEIVDGTLNFETSSLVRNDVSGRVGPANPGNGGGVHVTGIANVSLLNSFVVQNEAASEGGGLWNQAGSTLSIENTLIDSNEAFGDEPSQGGGGVFNNGGTVVITGADTLISNNYASGIAGSGGGILNEAGGSLNITDATLSGNVANRAGGGIEATDGTSTSLTNVLITANNAGVAPTAVASPGNGGGLHVTGAGDVQLSGGEVSDNWAAREGGGLWNGAGTMTVDGTLILANGASGAAADDGGGGIFNNGGTLNLIAATLSDNLADGSAGSGGGLFSLDGAVSITDSTLSFNSANRAGGGIEIVDGTLTLDQSNLINNDVAGFLAGTAAPGNGGGLHVSGASTQVHLIGGSVFGNLAASEGGGLWNQAGSTLSIENTLIDSNEAFGDEPSQGGGGVFNNGGTVVITGADTLISNNYASGIAGSGGGILNEAGGSLNITDATLSGNVANRAGGGIEATDGTSTSLTNVLITANNAGVAPAAVASPGNGGGLHVTGAGDVQLSGGEVSDNWAAREGGGLWNGAGTMTVDGTLILANGASGAAADDGGGGIFNNGGTLNLIAATLSDNLADGSAGSGGGLFSLDGAVSITDSTLSFNSANRAGGGIEIVDGTLTLLNSVFASNDANGSAGTPAPGNGGAIHTSNMAAVDVQSSTFVGNQAAREGGAIWIQDQSSLQLSSGTILANNSAHGDAPDHGGGALFINGGIASIVDTEMFANSADGASGSGGAILNLSGTLDIEQSLLSFNRANRAGGGIETVGGQVSITNSTLSGNQATTAPGNGGALHVTGTSIVAIFDSRVTQNIASAEGGGLWNSATGTLTVERTQIDGNLASRGGGIFNDGLTGDISIIESTVSRNRATSRGGGMLLEGGANAIVNSTISSNIASSGAGIAIEAGTLSVVSATVASNLASSTGGGLFILGGQATLLNSILATNIAPTSPDADGSITSSGNNLFGDTNGSSISGNTSSDLNNVDPMLSGLAHNGGPTETHALLATSPAIDAGSNATPATDQRGVTRPKGTEFDIGAFERDPASGSSFRFDLNADGRFSAIDALLVINVLNLVGTGSPSVSGEGANPQSYDVNLDGMVSPIDALLVVNYLNAPDSSSTIQAPSAQDEELREAVQGVQDWAAEIRESVYLDFELEEELLESIALHRLRIA